MSGAWTLLVPLKPPRVAKSRLRGAVPGMPHEELVLALAEATVRAASGSPEVGRLVVIGHGVQLGFELLPDRHGDLNEALREAAAQVRGPVAAMPADLPALRPGELTEALRRVDGRGFVPDAEGTGTVLLAAQRGPLRPCFGPGSAKAHEDDGAHRLDHAWPTLRRDVDTPADLREALRLGWKLPTIRPMQGTVSAFDPDSRSGELLLDDGTPLEFGREAFDLSGLRLLRVGQRLRVEQGPDGRIEMLAIPTF